MVSEKNKELSQAGFRNVAEAASLFSAYEKPWAVCGGWAIDLFLGRLTRPHKDVDFVIPRKDQLAIQEYLSSRGWTLEKAIGGRLISWQPGEWIDLPVHTIWCKKDGNFPDFVELLFDDVDEEKFRYRREPSITRSRRKMILSSPAGIPFLAPEIVLLYKSGRPEEDPAAATDFENVLPRLSPDSRDWLAAALMKSNPDHIWLKDLS